METALFCNSVRINTVLGIEYLTVVFIKIVGCLPFDYDFEHADIGLIRHTTRAKAVFSLFGFIINSSVQIPGIIATEIIAKGGKI